MKKFFSLVVMIVMMSFAGNNLFAQNDETLVDEALSEAGVVADEGISPITDVSAEANGSTESQVLRLSDLNAIVDLLNNTANNKVQRHNILNDNDNVFIPLSKEKSNRGHFIAQRLELCAIIGHDRDPNEKETAAYVGNAGKENALMDKVAGFGKGVNFGMNFGYSLVFVPAHKQDNHLYVNKLGFAYSFGAVCQFDNEQDYGITCDLLGKVGFETGFNRAIGVGGDFLFGGGKTNGYTLTYNFEEIPGKEGEDPDYEVDVEHDPYTVWCPKIGAQFWIRLNFLTSSVKNFDAAVFGRFVYSFNPHASEQEEMAKEGMLDFFKEESWGFGIMLTYSV